MASGIVYVTALIGQINAKPANFSREIASLPSGLL